MIDIETAIYLLNMKAKGTDFSFSFDEKLKPVMMNMEFYVYLRHENRDLSYEQKFANMMWDMVIDMNVQEEHLTIHQVLLEVVDFTDSPEDGETYQINHHRVCYTCN